MKLKYMLYPFLLFTLLLTACTPIALAPTATPQPSTAPTATSSPTVGPTLPPQVPGMNPRAMAASLADEEGFTCAGIEANPKGYYLWRCERTKPGLVVQVSLFSRTKTELDLIDTNVNQPDTPANSVAVDLLSWSAAFANPGADQAAVRTWIEKTLPEITTAGDIRIETFNGTQYRLYGAAETRSLEIGGLPTNP